MQNKDKEDGIEDSPLDMLLVILLEGASKEVVVVVTPSSLQKLPYLKVMILEGLGRHPPGHFLLPHGVFENVGFELLLGL